MRREEGEGGRGGRRREEGGGRREEGRGKNKRGRESKRRQCIPRGVALDVIHQ